MTEPASRFSSVSGNPNTRTTASSRTDVGSVVDQYRGPNGQLDTVSLAKDLAEAANQDFALADQAYQQISSYLSATGAYFDAANLDRNVQTQFQSMAAGGLWAPNYKGIGSQILRDNPILNIQWESTNSALTNKNGFSAPLEQVLRNGGIEVVSTINPPPPGSRGPTAPGSVGAKNNHNGQLASDAIANRYAAAGYEVNREVNYDTRTGRITDATRSADALGSVRRVDVEVIVPGDRPEVDTRILVESKVGYTSNGGRAALEAVSDAELLRSNTLARGAGSMLENVGKVARPVGLALDIYSVGSAYQADGNSFGHDTQRTVSGIAGSAVAGAGSAWAGAAAGAAIGSVVPVVGTAIGAAGGGIIGGTAGGWGGDIAGKKIFDWFN